MSGLDSSLLRLYVFRGRAALLSVNSLAECRTYTVRGHCVETFISWKHWLIGTKAAHRISVGLFSQRVIISLLLSSGLREQRMTYQLFGNEEYSQHVPVSACRDTGEKSGFVASVLGGGDDMLDADEGKDADAENRDDDRSPVRCRVCALHR